MKKYIRSSYNNEYREFDYTMLRPLIDRCTNDYFDSVGYDRSKYREAVDSITQCVVQYFQDLAYEDFENYVKLYLDGNYKFDR